MNTKTLTAALQSVATGTDPKLTRRSANTVRELHIADYIRSVGGMEWHWELTERGQAVLADLTKEN